MYRLIHLSLSILLLSLISCLPQAVPHSPASDELLREQKIQQLVFAAVMAMRGERSNSLADAHAYLSLGRELAPRDPRILDGLGCVALRQGRIEAARELFQLAIGADRTYDRAYAHLAAIAERSGEYKAAVELLSLAVSMNPLNYRARNNLVVLRTEHGLVSPAENEAEFLKAYHTYPEPDTVLTYNRPRLLRQVGRKNDGEDLTRGSK